MLFIRNASNTFKEGIFYDEFFITTFPSKVQWIRHEEDRKIFHTVSASGSWRRFSSSFAIEWNHSGCADDLFFSPSTLLPEKKYIHEESFGWNENWQLSSFFEPAKSVNTQRIVELFFLFLESCPVLSFTVRRNLQSSADRYVNSRAVLSHEVHNTSDEKTSEFSRFAYTLDLLALPAFCDLARNFISECMGEMRR